MNTFKTARATNHERQATFTPLLPSGTGGRQS
jgi:hypothetical protein